MARKPPEPMQYVKMRGDAALQVEAWQDNHDRPFAHGAAHFLMPRRSET